MKTSFGSTLLALLCAGNAFADDAPAFDRPGIAFSTSTLPVGHFDWEQGLPDFSRDHGDGITDDEYAADTLLRAGLSEHLEAQLGFSAWNASRIRSNGVSQRAHGAGDSRVALKYALPSSRANFSWALLGAANFATGNAAFSDGHDSQELAMTTQWSFADNRAFDLYADAQAMQGATTLAFSPSYDFACSDSVSGFIEAGYSKSAHEKADEVAGGGFAWMATPRVQLDLSADLGLTRASTDVQAGFGVSVYF